MATNPSTEEHKEAVKEKISAAIENNNSNVNVFQNLGQTIGMALIDKMIKRENYLLFSITKVKLLDSIKNEKVVGFGILGKVYLIDDNSEKIEEPSNPIIGKTSDTTKNFNSIDIIGKPIKIGNLEVAEKDFPNKMNWEDAKKACENLGRGWRLPTKDELNTLYINKDKIGGFTNNYNSFYWSSTEFNDYDAWRQNILNGFQDYGGQDNELNVRAVRAF